MTIGVRYQWLLLCAVVLGVYYPAIFGGSISVDDLSRAHSLLNAENLDFSRLFARSRGYYYRPLVMATFFLDQILWGGAALIQHVENIFIHLINSSLVFLVALRLCRQSPNLQNWLPLLFAGAFALHPVNVEAVCWISGRYDLLATTFVLGSVCCLLSAVRRGSFGLMLCAIILAFLGCLAKETALFYFPGAILIIFAHARMQKNSFRASFYATLPGAVLWSAAALTYLGVRFWGLSGRDHGVGTLVKSAAQTDRILEWLDQLRIAIKVGGFYFKKIIFPYPLNFAIVDISHAYLFAGILLIFICLWLLWRQDLAAAFFLSAVLIASSALLVIFGKMAWTPIAERYLYMPSAFFIFGWVAWASLSQNRKSLRIFNVLLVGFVIIWGGMTIQRVHLWSNPIALAEDTVEKSPDFTPARKDLANLYLANNQEEKGQQILSSIKKETGKDALPVVDISLAHSLMNEGKLDEAHDLLLERLDRPGKQFAEIAKLLLTVNQKRISKNQEMGSSPSLEIHRENIMLLERLLMESYDPFLTYRMAKEYLALGNQKQAQKLFDEAYRKAPSSAFYRDPARRLAEKLSFEKHE